jgi:hypothetical protein
MAQELCRHPGCTCSARADGFCSDACARSADAGGELCPCGHDECAAPTKAEGWGAVADLAPQGRTVADPKPRDW